MPPTSTTTLGPIWWLEEVEKRTNGQVKFETFWAGSLVKKGEDLDGISSGLLDVCVVNCTNYPDRLPLINVQFPVYFAPTDPKVLDPLYLAMFENADFINDIERYNTKFLFAAPVPGKDLSTTVPIKTLDDFAGKKIGAIGVYHPQALAAIDAAPVSMGISGAYQALQTGVIEGQFLPTSAIYSYKLFEAAKHLTEMGLGAELVGTTVVNRDVWDSLPPNIQQIMEETAIDAYHYNIQLLADQTVEAQQVMKDAGVTFYTLSQTEKTKWASLLPNFPQEWVDEVNAKGQPGTEIMTLFIETAKELGHEFPREWSVK